jgi:hypothetical protein
MNSYWQTFGKEYRDAGCPLGRAERDVKKWAKTRLTLVDRFHIITDPLFRAALDEIRNMRVGFLSVK